MNELIKTNNNSTSTALNTINLFDESSLKSAEIILGKLIKSNKSSIKTIEDGLAIMIRAQELNIPFSTFADHSFIVNGKVSNDVHVAKSCLSKAGVTWELVKDMTPLYKYTDGDTIYDELELPKNSIICRNKKEANDVTKDGKFGVWRLNYYKDLNNNLYNEFELSDKVEIALNLAHANKLKAEGKFPVIKQQQVCYDRCTEYHFTRYRVINGREVVTHAIGRFTLSQANAAGLLSKDTYRQYPNIMIGHRAFMFGAREIADDALFGMLETTELKVMENIPLNSEDINQVI